MIQSNGQTHAQRTVSSADKVFQSLGQTHQLEYNPESFLSVLCRCSNKARQASFASRSLRRALSTPQDNPGPRYRCCWGT